MEKVYKFETKTCFTDYKIIKQVAEADKFLNQQTSNQWQKYIGNLQPGKYIMVGGEWRNISSIDKELLVHL